MAIGKGLSVRSMDPMLMQFIRGERGNPTLRITFLVGGALIRGFPRHPGAWAEDVSALLDQMEEEGPSDDELQMLHSLRAGTTGVDDDDERYITLWDVTITAPGQSMHVATIRLAVERVAAWWVRSPSQPDVEGTSGD